MHVLVLWFMTPRCSPAGGSKVLVGLAWSTSNPADGPQWTTLRHSREYHRVRHCGRNHGALTPTYPEIEIQEISVFFKVSPHRPIKMYKIARGFCCFRVDEDSTCTTDERGSDIYSDCIHILCSALFTTKNKRDWPFLPYNIYSPSPLWPAKCVAFRKPGDLAFSEAEFI